MALQSILVAFDGTHSSGAALDQAVEIAARTGAKLTLICVIPPSVAAYGFEVPAGATAGASLQSARRMLEAKKAEIAQKGVKSVETVAIEGDPVDRIVEQAHGHPTDLVVVGSRGLSQAGRFFLGSVSDGIIHHVKSSVLVVKATSPPEPPAARSK